MAKATKKIAKAKATKTSARSKTVAGTRTGKKPARVARTTAKKNLPIKTASSFGKLVRETRLKKGLTATAVAKSLGFTAQTVISWETRPKANIAEANISPLAKTLGLPVKKLAALAKPNA